MRALRLTDTEIESLFSTACGRIAQVSDPPALIEVLCALAEQKHLLIPLLIGGLQRVPDDALPMSVPNRVRALGVMHPDYDSSTVSYVNSLTNSTNSMLRKAAQQALAAGGKNT